MYSVKISSRSKAGIVATELTVLMVLYFVISWVLVPHVKVPNTAFYTFVAMLIGMTFYYFYVSPILLHQDSLNTRGLGPKKRLFIRTDNFSEAWHFLWFPVVFTGGLLFYWHGRKTQVFLWRQIGMG